MNSNITQDALEQLNSFLRGELSAIETYEQARDGVTDEATRQQLLSCQESHQRRAKLLRNRVLQLGGEPSQSSGPWGALAFEGSAKIFGEKAAIAALEEGEDHGLRDYQMNLSKLDADSRQLVSAQILPAQLQTHRSMSVLKHNNAAE